MIKYEIPSMEVLILEAKDVITTSSSLENVNTVPSLEDKSDFNDWIQQ